MVDIETSQSHRTRVSLVLIGVALAGLWYLTVLRPVKSPNLTDFNVYMAAGRAVLNGGSDLYQVTDQRGLHYIYPPLFAVLVAPLALLPPVMAATIWYLLNISLLVLALKTILDLVTPDDCIPEFRLLILPAFACAEPLLGTITRGQLGILMLACCAMALSLYRDGKMLSAGLLVSFATTLKIYPGVLIFYFLVRRDWRALGGCAIGAGVFALAVPSLVIGPAMTISHWTYWLTNVVFPFAGSGAEVTPLYTELHNLNFAKNQSLLATLTHIVGIAKGTAVEQPWVRTTANVLSATLLATLPIAWLHRKGEPTQYSLVLEWSLALLAGLLVIPVSWSHYFCLLLIPLAAATAYVRYEKPGTVWTLMRASATSAAVLSTLFAITSALRGPLDAAQSLNALMIVRSIGLHGFSSIVLLGTFFFILMRSEPAS